jgi:disulfide bond formation protein DsbB
MNIPDVNYFFALGTVAMQIAAVLLLVVFIFRNRISSFGRVGDFIGRHGLLVGFAFSFLAAALNFYYNEVLGVPPCDLCWWQRIFLYPQVLLFGMAAWKRDSYMADYSIVLSVFGAGFALYHHLLQMFPNSIPCPATGVSCAQRFMFEFDYITYPMMSLSLFIFLIVLMLFVRARRA